MEEVIRMAADWILIIGATVAAIVNIAKFLGHPIKIFKKKQDKTIDERIRHVVAEYAKENKQIIEESFIELAKREAPSQEDLLNSAMNKILPTLDEIKSINLEQNGRIDILFDTSKDVLREKIMGIYHKNKHTRTLKIYEKEALDQYYKDYKKENGNSYIDRYYNRMSTWEVINSQYDAHYED